MRVADYSSTSHI